MRARFKIILSIVLLLIISFSLLFAFSYFFDKESYAMNVVVDYPLSISYPKSNLLDKNNFENVKFTIINDSTEDILYTINLTDVKNSKGSIINIKSDLDNISKKLEVGELTNNILIKAGDKHTYEVDVDYKNINFKAQLYVSQANADEYNFYQTILQNTSEIKDEPVTKIGTEIATTDEGLIKSLINNETIYYYRGKVENNYVSFANNIWRIVSMDNDENVKLVLDNNIKVNSVYYSNEYDFKDSNAIEALNTWYDNHIKEYEDYLVFSGYCNDNTIIDSISEYSAYNRIVNNKVATITCLNELFYNYIGLLTIDEVVYAGASINTENNNFYLINTEIKNDFFLMSGAKNETDIYFPFALSKTGEILVNSSGKKELGIRPVININNSVLTTGDGTKENPYVLSK